MQLLYFPQLFGDFKKLREIERRVLRRQKLPMGSSQPALIPRGWKRTMRECSPGLRKKLIRTSRKAYKMVTVITRKHRNPGLVSCPVFYLLMLEREGSPGGMWNQPERHQKRRITIFRNQGLVSRAHPRLHSLHSLQGKAHNQCWYWLRKHSSTLLLPYWSSCLLLSYW